MPDNSAARKKTLVMLVLLFLLAGGGIFLFLIIQGADDLTGAKNKKFEFGTAAREGVSSFFKYIGIGDDGEALAKNAIARTNSRSIPTEEESEATAADVSDWMAPSASASGAPRPPSGNTVVPRMGGGSLSGAGGIGAGGSKSSGGISRFEEGSQAASVKVTSGGPAGRSGGPAGKLAFASLKNARANLGEGLRSGSAVTAKGKWDSSFGLGTTKSGGAVGGALAYSKGGLVKLDAIKSGEIDNLKMDSDKSLTAPEPKFKQDAAAEAKDKNLQDAKATAKDALRNAGTGALSNTSGTAGGGDSDTRNANQIPSEVTNYVNSEHPNGPYCPAGCPLGANSSYTDNAKPEIEKISATEYKAVYVGVQTGLGGAITYYKDVCTYNTETKKMSLTESYESSSNAKSYKKVYPF